MKRAALVLSTMVLASCAPLQGLFPGRSGCHADYMEHYSSLPVMVDRAETIVRGRVVGIGSRDEGYGLVRTVTLRIAETLKGGASGEVSVVEGPCLELKVREGDEWVAFL